MKSSNNVLLIDSNKLSNNKLAFDSPVEAGRYKLLSFCLTNNIFNISDNNNKVYFTENSVPLTSTLTNGYYNPSDFRSHLQTKLDATASGTITCSLDDKTNKLTISNDTHNFNFTFATNTTNSARKLLGFNATDGTGASSQTSDNPIDLNSNKCFFVDITENDDKNINGTDYFNTSLMIQTSGDFGETSRYIANDYFAQYIKIRKNKNLNFSFTDINNNAIDLNSEWVMTFGRMNH